MVCTTIVNTYIIIKPQSGLACFTLSYDSVIRVVIVIVINVNGRGSPHTKAPFFSAEVQTRLLEDFMPLRQAAELKGNFHALVVGGALPKELAAVVVGDEITRNIPQFVRTPTARTAAIAGLRLADHYERSRADWHLATRSSRRHACVTLCTPRFPDGLDAEDERLRELLLSDSSSPRPRRPPSGPIIWSTSPGLLGTWMGRKAGLGDGRRGGSCELSGCRTREGEADDDDVEEEEEEAGGGVIGLVPRLVRSA